MPQSVLFRNRNRNPDVLDPTDGGLKQDAEYQERGAVPHRVIYGVVVTVIINAWES